MLFLQAWKSPDPPGRPPSQDCPPAAFQARPLLGTGATEATEGWGPAVPERPGRGRPRGCAPFPEGQGVWA